MSNNTLEFSSEKEASTENLHVGRKRLEESKMRIEVKLHVLEHWLANGIPWRRDVRGHFLSNDQGKLLAYCPKSLNQAREWSKADNGPELMETLSVLKTEGIITDSHVRLFRQNKDDEGWSRDVFTKKRSSKQDQQSFKALGDRLDSALKALKFKEYNQLEGENKNGLIEALKQENRELKLLLKNMTNQYVADRESVKKLEDARRKAEQELGRFVSAHQEMMQQKDNTIATLTTLVNKVAPMRQVPSESKGGNDAKK